MREPAETFGAPAGGETLGSKSEPILRKRKRKKSPIEREFGRPGDVWEGNDISKEEAATRFLASTQRSSRNKEEKK